MMAQSVLIHVSIGLFPLDQNLIDGTDRTLLLTTFELLIAFLPDLIPVGLD